MNVAFSAMLLYQPLTVDIPEAQYNGRWKLKLPLTWQDKRQVFDTDKERFQKKIYLGDYQFNKGSPRSHKT